MQTKPFDLDAAIEGAPVVTADGQIIEELIVRSVASSHPVLALAKNNCVPYVLTMRGELACGTPFLLMRVPETVVPSFTVPTARKNAPTKGAAYYLAGPTRTEPPRLVWAEDPFDRWALEVGLVYDTFNDALVASGAMYAALVEAHK